MPGLTALTRPDFDPIIRRRSGDFRAPFPPRGLGAFRPQRECEAMNWHKWLIRGLVLTLLGTLVGCAALYALWTNPQAIRLLVQEKLGVRFLEILDQLAELRAEYDE